MIVGIDIDEPIYPWLDVQHELCLAALGMPPETPVPGSWHPYEAYGVSEDRWYEILAQGAIDGSLYDREIQQDAVEQLHRLREAGHKILLVTTRGGFQHGALIRAHTAAMVEKFEIPHDALVFTADKSLVATDFSLDDRPDNVDAFIRGRRGWIYNHYLLSHPHNRKDRKHPRVGSMKEFVELVLEG